MLPPLETDTIRRRLRTRETPGNRRLARVSGPGGGPRRQMTGQPARPAPGRARSPPSHTWRGPSSCPAGSGPPQCTARGGCQCRQPGWTRTSRDGPGGTLTSWALGYSVNPAGTGPPSRRTAAGPGWQRRPYGPRRRAAGRGRTSSRHRPADGAIRPGRSAVTWNRPAHPHIHCTQRVLVPGIGELLASVPAPWAIELRRGRLSLLRAGTRWVPGDFRVPGAVEGVRDGAG